MFNHFSARSRSSGPPRCDARIPKTGFPGGAMKRVKLQLILVTSTTAPPSDHHWKDYYLGFPNMWELYAGSMQKFRVMSSFLRQVLTFRRCAAASHRR